MSRKKKAADELKSVAEWAKELDDPTQSAALKLHKMQRQVRDAKRNERDALKLLGDAKEQLSVALEIANPRKPARFKKLKGVKREATAVVLASDWHVEEVVDPKTVNGRNKYNPDISKERARRFAVGTAWLINHHAQSYKIPRLVLWLGGDMITGYIHEEFMETNAMSPTHAVMLAQSYIIASIDYILENTDLDEIQIVCSYGNHGRTHQKKKIGTAAENSFEWLMYHTLAQYYAGNDKINFLIADGSHTYVDVYDWTIRFHHGDDVRYWGGVGGLSVPLNKAIKSWDTFKHADLTCIGHFHQLKDFGAAVSNGSLIGYNAFALSIKAEFEYPRQAFFLIDSDRGKCHVTPIWVDEKGRTLTKKER